MFDHFKNKIDPSQKNSQDHKIIKKSVNVFSL
jgi:hypothetical protein